MPPKILAIEGNIGAGKSTLLDHVRQQQDPARVVFMQEPVDLWETVQDDNGETILSKFYRDPAKYSFPFQVMAYTSRLAAFQRAVAEHPDCEWIVCERSLDADRHIFAQMLYEDGMLDEVMFRVYMMLYENTAHLFPIDKVIYVDASPEVCLRRIEQRARGGEQNITLAYLTKCKEYYDHWLFKRGHVVRLDADFTANYGGGEAAPGEQWIRQILSIIEEGACAAGFP